MGNEIPLTDLSLPSQVHGVLAVTPVFVQPVKIVDNPQPVSIAGTVTIVQPVQIATPIEVFGVVSLATNPTIDIGTVTIEKSTTATTIAENIGTTSLTVLGTNLNRKGFAIQATNAIVFVKLDSIVSISLYSYELPKKGILEIENYCGPVSAVGTFGSTVVMVTEKT